MMKLSLNKEIIRLALPSILASITVPLVGIVDLAIAGHLGDAVVMSGIVVGTMLFDILYWNMSFLRTGTGGLTAQAFGRKDWEKVMDIFSQGIATALATAMVCIAVQWLYAELCFLIIPCSPHVEVIAREYFFTRIWAVPATLSLFVFRGWFIGMQNTLYSMVVDVYVNIANGFAGWFLAFHTPLGIRGISVGVLIAQWSGLVLASVLMGFKYGHLLRHFSIRRSLKWQYIRHFFTINVQLFIRSFFCLVVYQGFTIMAATFGDAQLAVSNVMMKLLLLYSYFLDGFAYAGEALTGRFIGEGNKGMIRKTVRNVFFWAAVVSIVSTVAYSLWPRAIIGLITTDAEVLSMCEPFLFWLILMPVVSCTAFTWDGIYIGATATSPLMKSMVISALLFVGCYYACKPIFGIQSIYIAYFVHLLYRSVYQSLIYKKAIFGSLSGRLN